MPLEGNVTGTKMLLSRVLALVIVLSAGSVSLMAQVEDPVALFDQAQDLHEKGDRDGAVKLYEKALAVLPEFPEAEYQRAAALSSLGRSDDAIKGYLRAAELRPDWALAYAAAGGLMLDAGRIEEARRALTKALELQPSDPSALASLADLYIRTKAEPRLLTAVLEQITIVAARPGGGSAVWAAKAGLENELGKPTASRISLEKALALNPSDKNALLQMARRALTDGDLDRANELAKRLEAVQVGARQIHLLRAEILFRSSKSSDALKELEALPIGDPAAAELRGQIISTSASSPAEIEKQLEAAPNNPALLGRLCGLYRTADPSKALAYCKRASEAEPNNVNHAVGFGAALVQAKQYDQAVTLLRKLTNFAPDNWTAHANLATALFQLNRLAEAKKEYDWLAEKQPNSAAPHLFLGIVHDRLGEFNEALLEYRAYLQLADPSDNKADIDKVNLRLPSLEKDIKKGKKN
jgi:tetratricopeptide (TPR) repeat protein